MVCSVPLHLAHNEWHTDARCTGRLGLILPRSLPPAGYRMAGWRGAVWVQRTVQRVEERRPSRRQLANHASPSRRRSLLRRESLQMTRLGSADLRLAGSAY